MLFNEDPEHEIWWEEREREREALNLYYENKLMEEMLAAAPPAPQAAARIPDAVEHYGGIKSDEELFPDRAIEAAHNIGEKK